MQPVPRELAVPEEPPAPPVPRELGVRKGPRTQPVPRKYAAKLGLARDSVPQPQQPRPMVRLATLWAYRCVVGVLLW
jgi:hypothetical protein